MKLSLPRFLHRFYAFIMGYFWVKCPICGNYFGGHEKGGLLLTSKNRGVSTCFKCKLKAVKMNNVNYPPSRFYKGVFDD